MIVKLIDATYLRKGSVMPPGYKTNWTPKMDALLGTMPDQAVADQLGCGRVTVGYRRNKLGVPTYMSALRSTRWTPEADALLGTILDREVARRLNCTREVVWRRRQKLNVPALRVLPPEVSRYDPEADRIYHTRRRHRKLGVRDTLTLEQWNFACEWFDDRCAYCGRQAFLAEDHRIPLSKGGDRTALNILPACRQCNSSKNCKQAHTWIYQKFGKKRGKEIVDRIVAYLTIVKGDGHGKKACS